MAASIAWRSLLNTHPIFDLLRKNLEDGGNVTESKRLMVVQDGELFIWNPHTACILTTNLKLLQEKQDEATFQKLLCSNPPIHNVEQIIFNETGCCLALVGPRGVSVMVLPQRWGKNAHFEGGKQRITARTVAIGERFFISHMRVKVLDVAWHPGSPTSSQLVILTSDNVIRNYDIEESPHQASQTWQLTDEQSLTGSCMSLATALGDQAVAMAFAPPVDLVPRSPLHGYQPALAWPLYLLWANGDIYCLHTTITPLKGFKSSLVGPLLMYPPAEDNYGSDACSLLRVGTSPPVLVIATPAGKLYHCVVLARSQDQDSESQESWQDEPLGAYQPLQENSLYLYESVELELSLTTVALETDEVLMDDFTCPIRLHSDGSCLERYHCSHSAGVHSVMLPWLSNFQRVSDKDLEEELVDTEQAIVEHLVCTKPLPSSAPCPILGVAVTSDRLLGSSLLALTSEYKCIALALRSSYQGAPQPLLSSSPGKKIESPLRKLHKEPFDRHIMRILQKSASNPLLKTSEKTELSSQECFQLLTRATQVFREEYLQKFDMAAQEIQRRVRVLKEQKAQQFDDLADLGQQRNIMTEKAHQLAERYEDASEHHRGLITRIEVLLRKLQARLPMLSEAERNMHRELKDIDDQLQLYTTRIKEVRSKMDYQERECKLESPGSSETVLRTRKSLSDSPFTKTQSKNLQSVLKEEQDQIQELMKQIKCMKLQVQS